MHMAKEQLKTLKTEKDQINYTSDTPMEYNLSKKSRQQINREYYWKTKEKRKAEYQQQKTQAPKPNPASPPPYSQASQYKVLISLKDYTQFSKATQKLWLNFIWTFKDLNETGFHDLIQIMKIREEAENLVNDYWTTAKSELKQSSRSWNSLTDQQQDRLIRYWGQEKARWGKTLTTDLEWQTERGKVFEREIKELIGISVLHEERGQKGCGCWSCENFKQQRKAELGQLFKEDEDKQSKKRVECPECGHKVINPSLLIPSFEKLSY